MSNNGRNVAPWKTRAFHATPQEWISEYDRWFKAARNDSPAWDQWGKIGQIELNQRLGTLLNKVCRREGKIIDVGCGPGLLAGALLTKGCDAYGCDVSGAAIEFAKKSAGAKNKGRFFQANVKDLKQNKHLGQYSTVVCGDVIEYMPDPEAAFRVLWDLLEPGGIMILTTPKQAPALDRQLHVISEQWANDMLDRLNIGGHSYSTSLSTGEYGSNRAYWILSAEKHEVPFKYVLLSGSSGEAWQANDIVGDGRIKTGVFNWQRLFRGHAVNCYRMKDPEEYDVIHIQISGTSFDASRLMREALGPDSNTKIVVNLDYAMEFWYMYPPFPEQLMAQLKYADYIFSVEPTSAKLLSSILKRTVHIVPHPADIDAIKRQSRPVEERKGALVLTHRDNQEYPPYWMLYGTDLHTRLIGRMSPVSSPTGDAIDLPPMIYDVVHDAYMGGEEVISHMSDSLVCVDAYTHHVAGRSAIELAALGVPTVGYDNVWAQRKCFPDLTIRAGELAEGRELVHRLVDDPGFYRMVSEKAQREVEFFNYDNAYERFTSMLGVRDGNAGQDVDKEPEAVRPKFVGALEPVS